MATAYKQGDIVSNDKGERLQLVGGRWQPIASQEEASRKESLRKLAEEQSPLQSFLISAGKSLGGEYLYGSAPEAMEALREAHPVASFAGSVAPALVTGVATGGATAGMGLAARMGLTGAVEAGMGALSDAENPLQAAALAGTLGGLAPGVLPALGAAGRGVSRALGGAREAFDVAAMGVPGMAGRVQSRIMNAAASAEGGAGGGGRGAGQFIGPQQPGGGSGGYLEGFLTPDEAIARGVPLTPGDEMLLRAGNAEQANFAGRLRRAEELRSTDTTFGAPIIEAREAQKAWTTRRVAEAAGMDPSKPLTDGAVGQAFQRVGAVYDDIARQVGEVPIDKGALGELEGILIENSHRGYITQIGKLHNELEGMLQKGGGTLSAKDWQALNHSLGKKINTATKSGDVSYLNDLHDYQEILQGEMLKSAPPAVRETLQTANEQYRMLKILTRSQGVRTAEGEVNLPSLLMGFGNNPARFKNVAEDQLLRELSTMRALQTKLVPSSGTAERILANLPRAAVTGATGPFTWGAAGALGAYKLFGGE